MVKDQRGPRIGTIPTWTDFWGTNGLLIVFGISAAAVVGWRAPAFALAFPAALLINAIFFHLVPTSREGRPNPGFFTALLLYIPNGIWAYAAAAGDGVLGAGTFLLSVVLGALAMASVVVILILGSRLGYSDVDPTGPLGGG